MPSTKKARRLLPAGLDRVVVIPEERDAAELEIPVHPRKSPDRLASHGAKVFRAGLAAHAVELRFE